MRLIKLKLSNFKGMKSFELSAPQGSSIAVFGDNATGKTTLADALTYVLFDKDTLGRAPANFGIKTIGENGEPIHGLDHEVEAVFADPDVTLRKVYKEKWTRSRGSAHAKLDTHETDYYIDDEPVRKKEYGERISEIMSEDEFRMLTVPNYFAEQLHWKERRKMLQAMAGEIDQQQVIESDPELSDYLKILDGKTAEARRVILENARKAALKDIDNIPSRIDELNRRIKGAEWPDESADDLAEEYEKAQERVAMAQQGGGVSALQVKMEELESERQAIIEKAHESAEKASGAVREKIEDLRRERNTARSSITITEKSYYETLSDAAGYEQEIESAQRQLEELQGEKPKPAPVKHDKNEDCPYCGQPMKDGKKDFKKAEKEYKQYLADFNSKKAAAIKDLKVEIAKREESLAKAKSIASDLAGKIKEREDEIGEIDKEIEVLEKERSAFFTGQADVKNSKEYKAVVAKKAALQKKIDEIRADKAEAIKSAEYSLRLVQTKMKMLDEAVFQEKENRSIRERIAELQSERKRLQEALEQYENGLYVIQRFEVARSEIVSARVNEMFDIVQWKMYEEQINGGINDQMCEPVVNGVSYSAGLNNAMRIQAGLDIISTLGKHLGKSAPVVVDNAEAITAMNTYRLQLITLYVSEKDKQLRLVVEK